MIIFHFILGEHLCILNTHCTIRKIKWNLKQNRETWGAKRSGTFLFSSRWIVDKLISNMAKEESQRLLDHYILIDSVIFVRGLWTTKQGLKGNWPSSWRVTDTLSWRSLILLLSLHEAYITNYNAYRVIHHLMDLLLLFCPLSFSFSAHERPGRFTGI